MTIGTRDHRPAPQRRTGRELHDRSGYRVAAPTIALSCSFYLHKAPGNHPGARTSRPDQSLIFSLALGELVKPVFGTAPNLPALAATAVLSALFLALGGLHLRRLELPASSTAHVLAVVPNRDCIWGAS